jgi:replicative DNA helicase
MTDKALQEPYSLDAEEAVVACLIKSDDESVYDSVTQIIGADDFYVERPRIFCLQLLMSCTKEATLLMK